MKNVMIAGYVRSPFHFAKKGGLAKVRPDDLAAQVVAALVERTRIDPATIEDVIMGCAMPEGEQGLNIARLVAFLAKLPEGVAGTTVNRFCGSSMQAIHMAAGAIQMGAGDAFICAGIESMTRVPMTGFNPSPNPRLVKEYPEAYISMGQTAENLARKYQVTRGEQERLAVASHQKAAAARAANRLKDEIVPIKLADGSLVPEDGCIRPETTAEILATLAPAFDADGTVTAGTSSPLTDGASATLICSEEYATKNNLDVLAQVRSISVAGCPLKSWAMDRCLRRRKRSSVPASAPINSTSSSSMRRSRARPSSASATCILMTAKSTWTVAPSRLAIRWARPVHASPARRRRY